MLSRRHVDISPHRESRFSSPELSRFEDAAKIGTRKMTLLGPAATVGGAILTKFMMSLRDENYRVLTGAAIDRGISAQDLLRAVIIPDWVRETSRGIDSDTWPSS